MSAKAPQDHAVRSRLTTDLDTSFVVEAAAGTGKTTVLVSRIVAVVRSGRARLEQIIAVTFTEKAAGEMKLRLREALELARRDASAEEQARLTTALEELEVARVSTIHGLCADLLREYPIEAGVDPLFEVASEDDADALLDAAFSRWFQGVLSNPGEGVRRLLRRRPRYSDEQTPRGHLFDALRTLVEHRDFDAPWRRDPFSRDAELDALVPRLQALGALLDRVREAPDESWFLDGLREVRRFADDLAHRETLSPRDHDGLEALLHGLRAHRAWEYRPYKLAFEGLTNEQVVAQRDAVHGELDAFLSRADADLAACLHAELQPVLPLYELEKSQAGYLDFVDLLLRTRDLVCGQEGVRRALQQRFTHLFVDEFQDTDPLQTELLLLLAADDARVTDPFQARPVPGKLFAVGDPKQSIYRFRRADVVFYSRVKAHLGRHGAEELNLSTSFRSTPGIQRAVNGAFQPVMAGGHQASYVQLAQWRERHEEQPSVVALSVPRPYAPYGKISKTAVEESVPDAVAAFIEFLVKQSGWTVQEGEARVPVAARHICVLFKRFRGFAGADIPRQYARALEARRVPHVLVGGRSFHAREEVLALRTALWAVERPDDELSVYATLRGPFFALTDDTLLAWRHELKKLHPLRPLELDALPPPLREVGAALQVLGRLHRRRNRRPAADTLHELLEVTRAHAGLAFWSAGDQALANVLQLGELARRSERRATSFREVVEALQTQADEGEGREAPIVEEGTEGVRMMTVHTAKGLEFPVVILAEPTANVARRTPSHWVDPGSRLWAEPLAQCVPSELREHQQEVLARDLEEAVRLSYVAATRACDLLVVPAVADKELPDTWTSVLYPSIYPTTESADAPKKAPGCPEFGSSAVLERPGPPPFTAIAPGLHVARSRQNRVVWWDPKTLELNRAEPGGLQYHDALSEDPTASAPGRAAYEAWRGERSALIAAGSAPTTTVIVARELERPTQPGAIRLERTQVARGGRPGGRRFGALVHGVLAQVPLDASGEAIAALAALEARAVAADDGEREAAVAAVQGALAHPLLRQAAALPRAQVRREAPVVDLREDGSMLEGTVDLAFDDGQRWTVVEFKTDEELEPHREAYEAQTEAYVRAIENATGKKAAGVILQV